MIKSIFLLILISGFRFIVFSQTKSLNSITSNDLKKHLTFIASDSLQGRSFGTGIPGLDIAADYLANNARFIGLKPGFKNYFQAVSITKSQPDSENTYAEIIDYKGNVVYKTDSVVGLSDGCDLEIPSGELVFAGFGWSDEKTGYDDFADMDLKGKVVIFFAGLPESFRKKKTYGWNNRIENSKIERAKNAGARTVIMVNSLSEVKNNTYNRLERWMKRGRYSLQTPEKPAGNDFIFITSSFAEVVLGKGEPEKLLTKISKKGKPCSFEITGFKVNVTAKYKNDIIETKNIAGVIEGSDPVLKNECVVFMAHYDHLGIDKSGDVFNGADDNGSGTVTLLEVAEAFMNLEKKPKRSIVFLWVTAEEVGMFGSKYYSANPIFSMEKTKACINLDMVGRVYEPRDSVWKNSPKLVKDFDGLFTLTNSVWPELGQISDSVCKVLNIVPDKSLPDYFLRSSDHFNFHDKGVPVINYATGYHADYHQPGDEVLRINFEKMKRVADLCFLAGLEIANR